MQAIILAGGKGTRLLPYTTVLPKPLMPIGDYPILEIILKQLKKAGIRTITLAVGHLAALLEAYFGDGRKWGIDIRYSKEDQPLGTAGPISLIEDLTDDFIVMNGDILTTMDYSAFIQYHISNNCTATIGVFGKEVKIDLGVLKMDKDFTVEDYVEKPSYYFQVCMGIYVFNPTVTGYIEKGKYLDLPDLIKRLIENNEMVKGYLFDDYWRDIGTTEDYNLALDEFDGNKGRLL